jgi:hypothetical protein
MAIVCPPAVESLASPAVSDFEKTPADVRELLGKRISQLGLRLEGSPVERFVHQLQRELERKGLRRFKPVCYLTDEWGCPDGQPVIGIPFYLADPSLARLERAMNDLEDEQQIMMYLRHEAGHAFNYAYRLYATPEWRSAGPYNPLQGSLPAGPIQPQARATHRRLVRAEASRRGLRRNLRGVAHAALQLAAQIPGVARTREIALC